MNQNYRIFIGDRPSLHLNSVQRALTLQNHSCHFAHDFDAAVETIRQGAWDIALINPLVFGEAAFALCRVLRAAAETEGVEIAFLTEPDDSSDSSHWTARALTSVQECVRIRQARVQLRAQIATGAGSAIDPLTGLCSTDRWHKMARTEAAQACQHRAPLSLLSICLKNADAVASVGGAVCMEHALQQVAAVLHAGTRGVDILARGAGYNFYLLTPQTDVSQISRIAQRLREAVQRHPLIADDALFPLEIASGISALAPNEVDEREMVVRALNAQTDQHCADAFPQSSSGGQTTRAA